MVLDLGSGGGLDVFLAANQIGPTGAVIGLDGSKVPVFLTYSSLSLNQDRI